MHDLETVGDGLLMLGTIRSTVALAVHTRKRAGKNEFSRHW